MKMANEKSGAVEPYSWYKYRDFLEKFLEIYYVKSFN